MAMAFVSPMMAALVAQYPAHIGSTKKPFTEDMLTMLPFAFLRWGIKNLEQRKTPPRFTAISRFHSSTVVSSIVLFTWTAALLKSVWTSEKAFKVWVTSLWTEAGSATSVSRERARPPPASICLTVSAAPARLISATTTRAPSLANSLALARPIPDPAPVMTATRSLSFILPPEISPHSADQEAYCLLLTAYCLLSSQRVQACTCENRRARGCVQNGWWCG